MRFGWKFQIAAALVITLTLTCLLGGCSSAASVREKAQPFGQAPAAQERKLREGLTTVLIMGLDDYERPEKVIGYLNKMQSDFMLLMVIDQKNNIFEGIHLNRDTMTEITRLGVFGDNAGTYIGQLALAHTYGSGGSDSCLNATKAVSTLLGGIPIHHYMTFTMDSVPLINDMVGGVTVTVSDDFSHVDSSLKKGEQITLMGEQALTYVRNRRDVGDMTNLSRMERQREYMNALYEKLLDAMKNDDGFLKKLTLKLADSFVSDCTLPQLEELSGLLQSCEKGELIVIDGKAVKGKEFMEFYVDQDALQAVIDRIFYE